MEYGAYALVMYALNQIIRIANFVSRSLVGLVLGFVLGILWSNGGNSIQSIWQLLK